MRIARIGRDEVERLAAVSEIGLAEGEADPGLKSLTDLACRLFDVPIALVTLVGERRVIFGGRTGIDGCGADRDIAFCSHALEDDDILVLPDTALDPRFADNPLVAGTDPLRFYAGAPLRAHSGHILGTLCLIDRKPHPPLSARDRQTLRDLARLALDTLESHRLSQARAEGERRFRHVAATSPDAIVCADRDGIIRFWNPAAEQLFGHKAAEVIGEPLTRIVPRRHAAGHAAGLARVAAGGEMRIAGRTITVNGLHRDGHELPIELSLSMWQEDGEPSFGAILRDGTARRAALARLSHMASHDPLTDLPNRGTLIERIEAMLGSGQPVHLLVAGISGLKPGQKAGDGIVREAAARLADHIGEAGCVARIGDDRFAILLAAGADHDPMAIAESIMTLMDAPFRVDGRTVHPGCSIGIASAPLHGATAGDLVSAGVAAMEQARREGRPGPRTPGAGLPPALPDQQRDLRRAIDGREFELHYQPQVRLGDATLIGAEALIRWNHPTRGLLLPADFLPAVEAGLLAAEIGTWVLEAACAQAVAWRRRLPGFRVGVNLFGAQFGSGRLAAQVRRILGQAGLDPAGLELEVTETMILRHDATMLEALQTLQAEGVGVAFDDFGTGFASLNMLKTYPLTRLKIDRSVVHDLTLNPADALVVGAVAALGTGLGLDVIAEGIETQGQRDLLTASGCRSGQGYLFGRPMPAAAFDRWIAARPLAVAGGQPA